MDDLFPPPPVELNWKPSADRSTPMIFLRELVLLETVMPFKPIRSIPFHPGLNIVWADPKTDSAKKGGSRLAGHSAGKSTFCRIIRWLLGESRYGKQELQDAIGTEFRMGVAALHLEIEGECWVVGRPFWNSKEHWAVRAGSITAALAAGVPEKHDLPDFLEALQRVTIGPLVRHHLPGETDKLVHTDLLAWLTRDQNCALQTVEAWRDTPSPVSKNIASKESRHILMRLVLDLLDDEEWKEMVTCAGLESSKAAENKRKPDLEASAVASCEPLRFIVPKDGKSLHGEMLIMKAEAQVKRRTEKLEALQGELAALNLSDAEEAHTGALTAKAKKEQEIASTKRALRGLEKRIGERNGEVLLAAQRRMDQSRGMPPGYCARKISEIEGLCEHYRETPTQLATHQLEAEIQKVRDHLQEQADEAGEALAQHEAELPFLEERQKSLNHALEQARKLAEAKQTETATHAAEIKTANTIISLAREAFEVSEHSTAEIKALTKDIKKSNDRQIAIRKRLFPDRIEFGRFFENVARYLMGEETSGYVEFDGPGLLALHAKTRTTLSSAAIDALTVIAFDLAAMFWSASGRGHHPRFLIHDSPRVADMSPVPYAAIFEVAHEAGKLGSGLPNFQYIITTTESPPDNLKTDHMILELDASTSKCRLFKKDF
jgi:hypothetical protein